MSYNQKRSKSIFPSYKVREATITVNGETIQPVLWDSSNKIMHCYGAITVANLNAQTDFAKGCLLIKTDATTGVEGIYRNVGTSAVSSFEALDAIEAGEITLAEGSLLLGNNAGVAAALSGETDAQILIGNGTTLTSVAISNDATIDNAGVLTTKAGLKTDLITVGLMGTVAEFGFPFNVVVNTEQIAALAKVDDGGVFANLAVSAAEAGYTANYQLFPDTELEDDAAYFGGVSPFGILSVNVSATVATYGADSLAWEYWNGTAWSALTIIYDETDTTAQDGLRSFQQDGEIIFSAPTDWVASTIDTQEAYWVRSRIASGFNITQIPLFDSVEHALVSSPTASEMPAAGTIGRGRISFVTVSGANADTNIVLCNLTKGTASAITTLTKTLTANEIANFAVTCDAGDQIAIYVTQEDGTTEFANGILEMNIVKS